MAPEPACDRRDFLKTAAGSLAALLSSRGLSAAHMPASEPRAAIADPVTLGVIGLGPWGREVAATVARLPQFRIAGVADVYPPLVKRSAEIAPGAAAVTDARHLFDSSDVEAVVIATPTPTHCALVSAALDAGKHVYCEAPLASSLEDARAIVAAASAAPARVVQCGLQGRANALYRHVAQFVRSGVLGDLALVNAQWNRRDSWRRAAPSREREHALNWRLLPGSAGLAGEVGVHQIDLMLQYLDASPTAVAGAGSVTTWRDGREVPDTVVCLFDFPNGVRATWRATLASSFGGAYVAFQGSNSSLLMKEARSWMVKEADSPLLGWEVYARKETVHDETGIAMVADATKLLQAGKEPGKDGPAEPVETPLMAALEQFALSVRTGSPSVCDVHRGYNATAIALKANEAVSRGTRVEIDI
jgi:predicted dehydrogenase